MDCSVNSCDRPVVAKGFCDKHYRRWRKHGDPEFESQRQPCLIEGCGRDRFGHGWCKLHYDRWRKHGDPEMRVAFPWPENLLRRMEPQSNGCIHFAGYINDEGYGRINSGPSPHAHRAAYEHFVGPIPDGMTIDHECHNRDETCGGGPSCLHRRCVNPEHLTPKPIGENSRASRHTNVSINANKTHCSQGHPYDEANTYHDGHGRKCRICGNAASRRYRLRLNGR